MRRIVLASTNRSKVAEIRAAIGSVQGWEIAGLEPGAPEIEETGETFLENAVQKAEGHGRRLGGWTLADDSGLEVSALGGRPGVRSSRYAPTDPERIARLLAAMDRVPEPERGARFVCALALALDGSTVWSAQEHIDGRITRQPRGTHGFGYDPVFWIPRLGRTMAELDPEEKNRISHRGLALARLKDCLERLE